MLYSISAKSVLLDATQFYALDYSFFLCIVLYFYLITDTNVHIPKDSTDYHRWHDDVVGC